MSNNGPYTDIDTQEYRPGPLTPFCGRCYLPEALCGCPPGTTARQTTQAQSSAGGRPRYRHGGKLA